MTALVITNPVAETVFVLLAVIGGYSIAFFLLFRILLKQK